VDIDVDSDRNGTIDGTPEEEALEETQAAIVPVNCDDDDRQDHPNQMDPDCLNGYIDNLADCQDLVPIRVHSCCLPVGWKAYLELVDGQGNLIPSTPPSYLNAFIQVFDGLNQGPAGSKQVFGWVYTQGSWLWINSLEVTQRMANAFDFHAEAYRFPAVLGEECIIRLKIQSPDGATAYSDNVRLRPSAFVLLPGYATAQRVYAPSRTNTDQDDEIAAVGTDTVSMDPGSPYEGDPWLQDAAEIGYTKWPGGQMHVVMDLPRDRSLEYWPQTLLSPGLGWFSVGGSGGWRPNYGGNIEAVGDYHVVIGAGCDYTITSLIQAQGAQSVVLVPQTQYLAVGHVDELVSFCNSSTAYIADVALGIQIIESLVNNNTHATGTVTNATADYIEDATANWTQDQWAGGYVEVFDTWYLQPLQVRQVVHTDYRRVYVFDSITAKGQRWNPVPDPGVQPGRFIYTIVARSEFRTVFTEGPEDFGVVTEQVSNNTFRDGSGLHDWSGTDWRGGYVILHRAPFGDVDLWPERYRIVSNTSDTITIEGSWQSDPSGCRYVVILNTKREDAFAHVYEGANEGEPSVMTVRHLWHLYGSCQNDWVSRIDELKNLLIGQTSVRNFIGVPALFDAAWGAGALIPNMVNMLNKGGALCVPNPYGPRGNNGEDLFKSTSPFNPSSFVDCWPLHGGRGAHGGEIHCGTIAIRSIPDSNWWN